MKSRKKRSETRNINVSLFALTAVIYQLAEGATVSYRTSKLTMLLKSSLGGNCRTAIICLMQPGVGGGT